MCKLKIFFQNIIKLMEYFIRKLKTIIISIIILTIFINIFLNLLFINILIRVINHKNKKD